MQHENEEIRSTNEHLALNLKIFADYLKEDLVEKYDTETSQLMQPLISLITNYVIYSGLYDDITVHLDKIEDIDEVVKNSRAYFIEVTFERVRSEEPVSQKMERDLINFAFWSLKASAGVCIEMRGTAETVASVEAEMNLNHF